MDYRWCNKQTSEGVNLGGGSFLHVNLEFARPPVLQHFHPVFMSSC